MDALSAVDNRSATLFESYLSGVGAQVIAKATCPFDPGYDPLTVEGHLWQSGHLMATLKLSMACWILGRADSARRKVDAARRAGIPVVAGGGPFEIAAAHDVLPAYLDLCAEVGFTRVECAEGFTRTRISPTEMVAAADERGMEVEFELGRKHAGRFTPRVTDALLATGDRWLSAGAARLVLEGRESAHNVGLFIEPGRFDVAQAERFVAAFGLDALLFEAPDKASQFALIDHYGPGVHLGNVRLEEVLRVEVYRRGLHADTFQGPASQPCARTGQRI
jgi:phosphosulfolactate synthase